MQNFEPWETWVPKQRAASAQRIAEVGRPLRRMTSPTIDTSGRQSIGDSTMVMAGIKGGLDLVSPDGRTPLSTAGGAADVVMDAFSGERVVVDTVRTARKVSAMASPQVGPRVCAWFDLVATIPLSGSVVVALQALDMEFWHPSGSPQRLGEWMAPLGIDPANPWPVLDHLATGQSHPDQMASRDGIARCEDGLRDILTGGQAGTTPRPPSSAAMNRAYLRMATAKAWADGYLALDARWGEGMVHSGEMSVIEVTARGHNHADVRMSSPCKVRPGDLMVVATNGQKVGRVELSKVGYDAAADCLTGKLRGRDCHRLADDMGVTAVPFTGTPAGTPAGLWGNAWTAKQAVERSGFTTKSPGTTRDVPLDVLLGAAAPAADTM